MSQNRTIFLTIKSIIALSFMFMFAANSFAVNMQYLKYSPVANFNADDFEMLQITGKKALENNKDGVTSEWKNSDTNNSGSITPINSSTIDGMPCRKTKITNETKTHSGSAIFTFCQIADGKWKILK